MSPLQGPNSFQPIVIGASPYPLLCRPYGACRYDIIHHSKFRKPHTQVAEFYVRSRRVLASKSASCDFRETEACLAARGDGMWMLCFLLLCEGCIPAAFDGKSTAERLENKKD